MTARPRRRAGTPQTGRAHVLASSKVGGVAAGVLATQVTRDLRHRLDALTESAIRVRAQRLRSALGPGGQLHRAHVTDAEVIHDLRVAARRLTAGLRLWRPALKRGPRRKALRLLRQLRRRFGPLREIEVHAAELSQRLRSTRPLPVVFGHLAAASRERYALERGPALERIAPARLRSLRMTVEDALAPLPGRFRDPAVPAAVRRCLATVRRTARSALMVAATADPSSIEPFHVARIAVKKWRYGEERWHAAIATESRVLERLRLVQESIGRAHDCATLRLALSENLAAAATESDRAAVERLIGELLRDERAALEGFRALVPSLLGRVRSAETAEK